MTSLRIAMVVPAFPQRSETFIVSKFVGLVDAGFDVHVVCDRFQAALWDDFPTLAHRPELARRVHPSLASPRAWAHVLRGWRGVGVGPARLGRALVAAGRTRAAVDAQLLALAPDVVHYEFGSLARGRGYLRDRLRCRTVVSFRGTDISAAGLEDRGYYDDVWAAADVVHFLGEDLRARALARGMSRAQRVVIIPPAIEAARFLALPRPTRDVGVDAPLRLLSVGRLDWKKGHEFALMALRRVLDRGQPARLRIVGSGEHRGAIYYTLRDLGLEAHVELLGALPPAEVLRQLEWADVFLHAAVLEGFCNAVLEAQAAGLPVICSDAGGLAENVANGESGLVVPRRDADAMARVIAQLAPDAERRRVMGEHGRVRIRTRFDGASQIPRFADVYRSLAEGPRG